MNSLSFSDKWQLFMREVRRQPEKPSPCAPATQRNQSNGHILTMLAKASFKS